MAAGDDVDSGMEECSLRSGRARSPKEGPSSKDGQDSDPDVDTPGGNASSSADAGDSKPTNGDGEISGSKDDDDELDETFCERLWGLTEMFPESFRNATYTFASTTQTSMKSLYGFSRSAFWIIFSSSIVLFAPVIFEVERAQMEEAQRSQQKQMLLGPNTAVSGGNLPLVPSMQR